MFLANEKQKKAGVVIFISDKIDLKIKNITRDKEGHYLMTANIYTSNIGAPQHIKQTLTDTKGETDSDTVIGGDFNTPLAPMDRS